MIKLFLVNSNRIRSKESFKLIKNFEIGFKRFYSTAFMVVGILLKMLLATILAIGSKPIILKINAPLGEGYATFASYIVAIGLYVALPDFWKSTVLTGGTNAKKV